MADKGKSAKDPTHYWVDQVDPELMNDIIRDFPDTTIDSKEKHESTHEVLCRPGPMLEGVESEEIPRIGKMYFPKEEEDSTKTVATSAAVLYIHGGGRIMGTYASGANNKICSRIAKLLNVPVLSAKYRLAPEHPFPAALDDLLAAYKWLVDSIQKKAPSITKENIRVGVSGESAGGGLAAELCQLLLDDHNNANADSCPLPVAQLLIYPMLDDRTSVGSDKSIIPHLLWSHTSNVYAWSAYLRPNHQPGQDQLPKYASAARRTNMEGLPPTWIAVGDLDVFRTECQDYATRMKDAGVPTKYLEVKGAYHGFVSFGSGEEPPVQQHWQSFQDFALPYLNPFRT
ncbi:unnamed protein product [Cylindrotheca closterium]|uniref:Alpha/beta hydrolase fold-3 domain-containing protein n=1 Tax=Cylindrotheca closterium TaxID=2856 RepID=A0AAD2JQ77_9STRA|nr:unnamed protein product [Cylindrotheca closterium]